LVYNEIIRQIEARPTESDPEIEPTSFSFEITHLGNAILKSGLSPEEGLLVYLDLQRAQKGIVLSNELHMLYLLSPVSLTFNVNWNKYHSVFNRLLPVEKCICEHIGIEENLIVAYGSGYASNETHFKREIALREKPESSKPDSNMKQEVKEDYASPVRLKVPSTGKTPLRHKLISQISKF
jgi:hypothetical protein